MITKKLFALTLLFGCAFGSFSQPGLHIGGKAVDYGYQVEATDDGGFVVAGRTYSYGLGDMDFWVVKFDSFGNKIWSLPYGSVTYDQLLALRPASDGSFLLAGLTGVFGSGKEAAMLYKIGKNGQVIWNKNINYGQADHAHVLFENYEGGYYMAGHTDSKGDATGDIWVVKLDSARNIVWDKVYGPQGVPEHAHAAALAPDSGVIVFGHTQVGQHEKFRVLKIDKNGTQQWAQTFSSSSAKDDIAYEVRVTKHGNYALFGSSIDEAGTDGTFWLKVLDPSGNTILDKHYGSGFNFCWSGRQTKDDGFIMIGYKYPGSIGNSDMIVMKTDSAGSLEWSSEYGGPKDETGYGLCLYRNDQYIFTGSTNGETFGAEDMWIVLANDNGGVVDFPKVSRDAAVTEILKPFNFSCDLQYVPSVRLQNSGLQALTSATINYQEDNAAVKTFSWTGNLLSMGSSVISLGQMNTSNGPHHFKAWTSNPNAAADLNPNNDLSEIDFLVDSAALHALPLAEGFEGNNFPPQAWRHDGSEGLMNIYAKGGFGNSSKSLQVNFTEIESGTSSLISPRIDLSKYASPLALNFNVAYSGVDTANSYPDSLNVLISDDCGDSWKNVYAKTGAALATAAPTTNPFIPANSQWRRELVRLDNYAGKEILIRFDAVSGYGNYLYIDDINLSNTVSTRELQASESVRIYPNPARETIAIELPRFFGNSIVRVTNVQGQLVVKRCNVEGNLTLSTGDLNDGVYIVSVESEAGHFNQKIVIQH